MIKRRSNLVEQQVGQELMVVDEVADRVHVLNPSSAFIWQCLAETDDVLEIERRLRGQFKVAENQDVQALIGRALQMFRDKDLLVTT